MKSRFIFHLSGLASIALLLAMGSALAKAQSKDSVEINKLFADAKMHAALAEYDSDTLYTYTDSPMSWESHAS